MTLVTSSPTFDRKATIRAVFAPGAPGVHLTSSHLTLMRRLTVMWVPIEDGAPGIDMLRPLLGQRATSMEAMSALDTSNEELAVRTLAELGLLVPAFVQGGGTVAPGRYPIVDEMRPYLSFPESGVDSSGHFELGEQHLTLLRGTQWRLIDDSTIGEVLDGDEEIWPMPHIDGKRPYGDCSYYYIDMADLLGQPYERDLDGDIIEDAEKEAWLGRLHMETLAALQVLLTHGSAVNGA
jgi:hypothetical protein